MIEKIKASDLFLTKKGSLISTKEVHAFGIGIYHGITPHKEIPKTVMEDNEDVRREPHYAKGGFIAGRLLAVGGGAVAGGAIL